MTLALPELDDLDLDQIHAGDSVHFTTIRGGLYDLDGQPLLSGNVAESTDEQYRAAWRRVEAWNREPENRRGNYFARGGTDFLVVTEYVGLDMTTVFGPGPHVPEIWETRIFTETDVPYLCRYYTRAAAFAGHDHIVEILTTAPGVTKIK